MTKYVGILTAGGDSPGLNAAIRGVGKAALGMDMNIVGFRDGFRGLMNNRTIRLDNERLSGILTIGGTIWMRWSAWAAVAHRKMPIGCTKKDSTSSPCPKQLTMM